jgi:hypothetical protein
MHGIGIADVLSWSAKWQGMMAHIQGRVHGSGPQQYIGTRHSSPSTHSFPIITPLNDHYYFTHYQSITRSLNQLSIQTTNEPTINMKFTLAAAASIMAATTMANPILGKHWGQRWGNNEEEGKRPLNNLPRHIDPSD